jgi:glycosyltransferase involved in cell wall biosynthesis
MQSDVAIEQATTSLTNVSRKKITIMTPCYNEEAGVEECYLGVKSFFVEQLTEYDYEHLFIDNCSQDNTVGILREIAAVDTNVKVIVNSRNFGPNHSPYYAILESSGDAVIPIVADLQTPVATIREFVRLWEQGFDMVLGIRTGMSEAHWLRTARDVYYRIMSRLSNIEHYHGFIGFGLYDRKTIEVMRKLINPNPYFRRIISEIGFKKAFVDYIQPPRKHGKSRLSFPDLIDYAILGMVSCSKVPLRFMTMAGLLVSVVSILIGLGYLTMKLFYWDSFALGAAPMVIGMFFLAAVQIFCLGMIGEYVGVIFDHVRNRPLVIESERINFK